MSWKNVELEPQLAEVFRGFLSDNGIAYESSGAGRLVHFEVLVDDEMTAKTNDFLNKL